MRLNQSHDMLILMCFVEKYGLIKKVFIFSCAILSKILFLNLTSKCYNLEVLLEWISILKDTKYQFRGTQDLWICQNDENHCLFQNIKTQVICN